MEDFFKNLSIDDMPSEDLKLVALSCGVDVAVKLLEGMPGMSIYVPKVGITQVKRNYICKNFNGTNAKKLALQMGYSESHLYRIMREEAQSGEAHKPGVKSVEIVELDLFNNGGVEGNGRR